MTSAVPVVAKLASGERVELTRPEAERLVAALWDVSARQGAVTAIGKLQHRLGGGADDREIEASADEAAAISAALDGRSWTGSLARLSGRSG